jgi:hypothetical protein
MDEPLVTRRRLAPLPALLPQDVHKHTKLRNALHHHLPHIATRGGRNGMTIRYPPSLTAVARTAAARTASRRPPTPPGRGGAKVGDAGEFCPTPLALEASYRKRIPH